MIVTRFAPSPTGYLHVGNLRTALMNWLIARQRGGCFILRLDDTDPERSRDEFVDAIREDLDWLGLDRDTEFRQSDRLAEYRNASQALEVAGRLYECFETPEELELKRRTQLAAGRPPVYDRAALALDQAALAQLRTERQGYWRFLLDRRRIEWKDGILGALSVDAESLSDPVLIRGDGHVLYTLASVVDDLGTGVSDVVRGSDHVTNTATQIQIFEALGGTPPRFAHHSLLTGPGGEPLSKRLGGLSLRDLRSAGTEPMALVSLMARLGAGDPVELRATLDEVVAGFELTKFGAPPTRFDPVELEVLSARSLHQAEFTAVAETLAALGVPRDVAPRFWDAVRANVARRDEIAGWWAVCQGEFVQAVESADADFVADALAMLPPRPWDAATWADWTGRVKVASGRKGKSLFMPLRQALTGRSSGPDMAALMPLLRGPSAGG
jgi:glutamyl-tRNA synthetase